MTAQSADNLINEHPRVDFGQLQLYFILQGDIYSEHKLLELPIPPNIPDNNRIATDLWRGYIATFRLRPDGAIELISYEFPNAPGSSKQSISNGALVGDFWLVFRHFFFGPSTSVPFRNGRVVENVSDWDIQDQSLIGRVVRRHENSGLLIDVDWLGHCFMPRSFLPPKLQDDLDALIGLPVTCQFLKLVHEKNIVVVKPIEFVRVDSDTS